jgi:hypothetical protein
MSYVMYYDKKRNWQEGTLALVEQAQAILAEYAADGFILTLRQLYYQFVSRNFISNSEKSYKRLGEIIGWARMNGDIDWDAIEDRSRSLRVVPHWGNPASIVKSAAHSYRRDKWATQPSQVEVWVEKEALLGVFSRICVELDVPVFACKGYTSLSEMKSAGDRFLDRHESRGQDTIVLHFGDHDPSGIDMTRDIQDRLDTFTFNYGIVQVERLALTMDQVTEWNPPPNPAKVSDSRFEGYMRKYGHSSWELDALKPNVLIDLVEAQIDEYRDEKLWKIEREKENVERSLLENTSNNWDGVVKYLKTPLDIDWGK